MTEPIFNLPSNQFYNSFAQMSLFNTYSLNEHSMDLSSSRIGFIGSIPITEKSITLTQFTEKSVYRACQFLGGDFDSSEAEEKDEDIDFEETLECKFQQFGKQDSNY
ncbi:hypothetical protein FGO68_gene5827 [Halteria grandinella]|uniref:Uncharacterized protein n=1 Tax=Halteria grandinella TaxID=5974 RepID=A0A8J8T5N8_HALGN|nr:hypothetical protein FGO68_gene5827 [Halteria grandinella]